MATMAKPAAELSPDDQKWGYRFGCDGFWLVKRVAEHLDCSPDTVYRLRDDGLIRTTGSGLGARVRLKGERVCLRSLEEYKASLRGAR